MTLDGTWIDAYTLIIGYACVTDICCNFGEERQEPTFVARATTETITLVVHVVTLESTNGRKVSTIQQQKVA